MSDTKPDPLENAEPKGKSAACSPSDPPSDLSECADVTELDVRGLACPLPVLRTNKAMKTIPIGSLMRVLSSDHGSVADMPNFCRQAGHDLVEFSAQDGVYTFLIRRIV